MKRITGAFVLLVGLGGCLSPTAPSTQPDKKAAAPTAAAAMPPGPAVPPAALPTNPQWTAHPAHLVARPPAPKPLPPGAALPGMPPAPAPAAHAQAAPPAGLAPAVHTAAQPLHAAAPPAARAEAKAPPAMPAGIPMVTTPRPEVRTPAAAPPQPPVIQQAGHVVRPAAPEPAPAATPPPVSVVHQPAAPPAAPVPTVPNSVAAPEAAKAAKPGAPLMRLVNTKRITLNFQVQNVGQSGLSSVELWYTQDGKDWKKYDAPTQAQAYVVEVDEEGMYGFTLLARSGLGLGKEPPAAGDQPQVWVIVDLSRPEVELKEVTPSVNAKAQQLTIRWKASDKNLARQPITLTYAEKEDGPWKVIAANLENNGQYLWQVPADAPPKFLIRAEAADLAGNVGRAQSMRPVLLDMMKPEVTITNVEAHAGQ